MYTHTFLNIYIFIYLFSNIFINIDFCIYSCVYLFIHLFLLIYHNIYIRIYALENERFLSILLVVLLVSYHFFCSAMKMIRSDRISEWKVLDPCGGHVVAIY
jgi:hypothetical protein